ncbi:protein of unknown function [Hyphomicrobium sp. MC1]|nr:protein of unknown function [Hyphomicrobium sp. MC1]
MGVQRFFHFHEGLQKRIWMYAGTVSIEVLSVALLAFLLRSLGGKAKPMDARNHQGHPIPRADGESNQRRTDPMSPFRHLRPPCLGLDKKIAPEQRKLCPQRLP